MRVNFEHKELVETHGFIRKTSTTYYTVQCTITPTEEERAIIKDHGLSEYIYFEQPIDANWQDKITRDPKRFRYATSDRTTFSLSSFLTLPPVVGVHRVCRTPSEAKQHEYELTEALKKLKMFIDNNKEIAQKSSTFEL